MLKSKVALSVLPLLLTLFANVPANAGHIWGDLTSPAKVLNVPVGGGANLKVDGFYEVDMFDNYAGDSTQDWTFVGQWGQPSGQNYGPRLVLTNQGAYGGVPSGSKCLNTAYRPSTGTYIANAYACSNYNDGDQYFQRSYIDEYQPTYFIKNNAKNLCLARNGSANYSRVTLKTCNLNDVTQRWKNI
jgi:hypothetical protein